MPGVANTRRPLSDALCASQGYIQNYPFLSKSGSEPIPGNFPNDFGKI